MKGIIKLFAAAVIMSAAAVPVLADDISTFQSRLAAEYGKGAYSSASSYLSSQQSDGSWTDVDYDDTSYPGWTAIVHLQRVQQMAVSYYRSANSAMLNGIEKGLAYWYAAKPSAGWWQNDIQQQLSLGPIIIMVEDAIDPALVATGATYMNDPGMTGQNLVWLATETVWRGCFNESLSDINKGLDAIKAGLKITTGEGIQVEGTFYQHHEQLYNGGYGRIYVDDVGFWITMTRGLGFAYSAEKMDVMSTLVLDGTQWMVRRGRIDPSCAGREISRPDNGAASQFLDALDSFKGMDVSRKSEYAAMADHIRGRNNGALVGNKHFWRSDYMAHRRSAYHMSVKMCSRRTYGTECISNENLFGRYLPFGCTYILVDGEEYANIFPMWDFALIPGVTAPYTGDRPQMPDTYVIGTTGFVGGASNGVYGAAVLDFSYDNTVAKKSWFMFNEGCMSLGAGITGTGGHPVRTSINQCLRDGDVTVSADGAGSVVAPGSNTLSNPSWVYHGGVGYVFPGSESVKLTNETRTARWYDINKSTSKDQFSKNVVTMWLEHGTNPTDAKYSYAVLPGMSKSGVQSFAASNPFNVISNTPSIQAVRHTGDNVTGIIFHVPGQLALGNGTTVKTDKACAMVVDESGDTASVTVSNPLNTSATVTVDLLYGGQDDVRHVFSLPSGAYAGKSVTLGGTGADVVDTTVVDPDPDPDPGTGSGDTAYVNGIGVIASGDDGNVAANTLDDDLGTRWSSNVNGAWIQYDLGEEKNVSGVRIAFYKGDERSTQFDVSMSTDGIAWNTVLTAVQSSGASTDLETFAFSTAVPGRYVRITGYGNTSNDWNSFTEVRIDTTVQGSGVRMAAANGLPQVSGRFYSLAGEPVSGVAGTGIFLYMGADGRPVKVLK